MKVTITVKERRRTIRISADKLSAVETDVSTRGGSIVRIEPPKKGTMAIIRGFKEKP